MNEQQFAEIAKTPENFRKLYTDRFLCLPVFFVRKFAVVITED